MQFSLVNYCINGFARLGRQGGITDDPAEVHFQPFLREAIVGRSGMGKDVHLSMYCTQHLLCRPRRHAPTHQAALEDGLVRSQMKIEITYTPQVVRIIIVIIQCGSRQCEKDYQLKEDVNYLVDKV